MSRADDYGAFYREARPRLLLQVYAYAGDTEVAQRALADAFISAGHHWRKLEASPVKDAWIRERAFKATGRPQNRSRKPWYASAMRTADDHRPLLTSMASLAPAARRLVILCYLARLDLPEAAREVAMTDTAARASLDSSALVFTEAGLDASPAAITAGLDGLRGDLHDEPADRASRLRREGNRRRRGHTLMAALAVLSIAIGAGAVTAAQPPAEQPDTTPDTEPEPEPPPADPFTAESLTPAALLRQVDNREGWVAGTTSPDFGQDRPIDDCVLSIPTETGAEHYWTRDFTSGSGDNPGVATQALEVARTPAVASKAYSQMVGSFATCRSGLDQVSGYQVIEGLGDAASMFSLRSLERGAVRDKQVAVARSGNAVVTWVVRGSPAHPVRPAAVLRMLGQSIGSLCADSLGRCGRPPYQVASRPPPPADRATGFLASVDLPVLGKIAEPWVATDPERVRGNPAATECDQADFAGAGAEGVRSRSFVIPDADQLAQVFGMTESIATFPTDQAADRFVRGVASAVQQCAGRQISLAVTRSDEIQVDQATGRVWQIELDASADKTFVFRMALVRAGRTVAQATFTPSESFDIGHDEYVAVAARAAERLTQL